MMNVDQIVGLLEQRSAQHRERANARTTPRPGISQEERVAAEVDFEVAKELDSIVREIRSASPH